MSELSLGRSTSLACFPIFYIVYSGYRLVRVPFTNPPFQVAFYAVKGQFWFKFECCIPLPDLELEGNTAAHMRNKRQLFKVELIPQPENPPRQTGQTARESQRKGREGEMTSPDIAVFSIPNLP